MYKRTVRLAQSGNIISCIIDGKEQTITLPTKFLADSIWENLWYFRNSGNYSPVEFIAKFKELQEKFKCC